MALDRYSGIPELSGEANAIARRRKIAEMMMAQSQEQLPVNQMAGQVVAPVSWTQGLAKLANAYLGKKEAEEADKAEQGLANKYEQLVAEELNKARKIAEGIPGVEGIVAQPERTIQAPAPMQPNQVAPNYGTVPETVPAVAGREAVPAVAGDKRRANEMLVASAFPELQRIAAQRNVWDTQDATLEAEKLKRKENAENALELAKQKMLDTRATTLEKQKSQQDFLLMMEKMGYSQEERMARLGAALRPAPAEKAPLQITDEAGNVKLVDYSGNVIRDLGKVGKPTAGFTKEVNAKKKISTDLDSTIKEMERITQDGGLIDQSTGSGIGAVIDMAAGAVGQATPGAIAIGDLQPIADMPLKMVPRFEGPQSDKDTASYKEAAGRLANPNIPTKIRKSAGKVILRLMKERKGQFIDKDNEGTEMDTGLQNNGSVNIDGGASDEKQQLTDIRTLPDGRKVGRDAQGKLQVVK